MLKRFFDYAIAPQYQIETRHYALTLPGLREGMRIVALSDFHIGRPWMAERRLAKIVEMTNALSPDLCVLPGDFERAHRFNSGMVPLTDMAQILSGLRPPLGRYAVTGNHDWWEDKEAQARGHGPLRVERALQEAGIPVLENRSVRLENGIWLAGIGSQQALKRPGGRQGVHGVQAALKDVPEGAPVILLAHEPEIFPALPDQVALTISGHTHAGQIRLFNRAPVLPYGSDRRYVHGHYRQGGKQLVVSAGLGCSGLPLRLGVIPEITVIDVQSE